MPIYEYDCLDCKHRFERLVRGGEEPERCPECGGSRLKRAFSVFASGARRAGAGGGPPPAPA